MKQLNKLSFQNHGKTVKYHKTQRGWTIVIMPDQIRIDTYHKPPHLHLEPKGIHIPIKFTEFETVGLIILTHIKKNKGINKEKLIEELV